MRIYLLLASRILMAVGIALFCFEMASAQKVTYSDHWNDAGFNLKTQHRSGVSIGYSIEEFTIAATDIEGRSMANIELPGFWLPNDEGCPNLPGGGRYIAIPQGAEPVLRIVSQRTDTYRNITIAPAPRIPFETEQGPLVYPTRTDIYNKNEFYPASPVTLSEPVQIRGVDVVMLGITPFRYNPVTRELIVYRDLEVELDFHGGNGQFGEERLRSRFWDPLMSDAILNYESLPVVDYSQRAVSNRDRNGCDYLIIIPDGPDYLNWAAQIKDFRIKQGIDTRIVTLSEIGANNVVTIENYINNVYNTWNPVPAAILFMGDHGASQTNNILSPIHNNYCVSDNIYADVNGDHMPEFVTARMTANDNTQLQTFVTKILNYETNPPTNPGFYNQPITALGWQTERWFQICSETVGGYFSNVHGKNPVRINAIYSGNPNYDPWSTATNTAVVLNMFGPNGLGYIPATPQELGGWSGGTATMVNNAINSGAFILQHRDHGMETGWGEPYYVNNNINGLTNTDLTFVFSINCLTGKYNWGSESFTEKFHRYRYNNVNSGALGLNAASETSYSFVNDTYVWGMFDNMWPDFMPSYGSTPAERGLLPAFGMAAGKYFLQQSSWPYNTSNKVVTYHLFHHHGCAFQTLYSEVPQDLEIIHDGVILAGLEEFTITANEGSTICLSVGDEIIGLAEGNGNPLLMTIAPQEVGTMVTVTVTKTNYYRFEETIEVIPATGAYCIYSAYALHDPTGNNNNLADYNETVSVSLTIRNVGLSDSEDLMVYLSTSNPYITITDSTESYGVIPSQQFVNVPYGFEFYVAEDIPDQQQVTFNIRATDGDNEWNSLFSIRVNAPLLDIHSLVINDLANGNGNGQLDPGEQVEMKVYYRNTGHAIAYNVDVSMEGQSGFVNILNPEQHFNAINVLGIFYKVFNVEIDENTPEGIIVNFINEMQMGAFNKQKTFRKKIGAKVEDFETGDFTKFDWQFAGNQPWQITGQNTYAGNYSARSALIQNNQSSELKLTYNVMIEDSIKFARKVSSEPNDKLQFYIDNVLQGEWSGTDAIWVPDAYPVSPGVRTFRWVYVKNAVTAGGSDIAWVDNIEFPPPMSLTIWAGPDAEECAGSPFQPVNAFGTNFVTCEWSTSGTGTFEDNTIIHPLYTMSEDDIIAGNVVLTLTLWDAENNNVSDDMVLTAKFGPEAPPIPEGPDYIDLFLVTASEYTTAGMPGSIGYNWYLEPAGAGAIESDNLMATITWNPDYLGMAYISVAAINECDEGEMSEAFEVTVDNTVGVPDPENKAFGISIYPNPGTGRYQVTLTNQEPGYINLRVFNLLGSKVHESSFHVEGIINNTLNLEGFPNGIYFLEVSNQKQIITKKLIKK